MAGVVWSENLQILCKACLGLECFCLNYLVVQADKLLDGEHLDVWRGGEQPGVNVLLLLGGE